MATPPHEPPAPDALASSDPSAIRDRPSHARLWLVAAIGLVADLASKYWAFAHLPADRGEGPEPLIHLQRSLNTGAVFGIGAGMAPLFVGASVLALAFVLYLFAHSTSRRRSLHVALGLILAGALGNLYDRTFHVADAVWAGPHSGWRRIFGEKVVGTPGVLLQETPGYWVFGAYPDGDGARRLIPRRPGWHLNPCPVVRDFIKINLRFGRTEIWPWIFNLADAMLVVGVGVLLLNFHWDRRAHRAATTRSSSDD